MTRTEFIRIATKKLGREIDEGELFGRGDTSCWDPVMDINNLTAKDLQSDDCIFAECEECGEITINGDPINGCDYSAVVCNTCGFAPCDESC